MTTTFQGLIQNFEMRDRRLEERESSSRVYRGVQSITEAGDLWIMLALGKKQYFDSLALYTAGWVEFFSGLVQLH